MSCMLAAGLSPVLAPAYKSQDGDEKRFVYRCAGITYM
jgi:hypothetical protein